MELIISPKGSKYVVQDKEQSRNIYTIKKKGFGAGKFVLTDTSNYQLYSLVQVSDDRKPAFVISHNEVAIMRLSCQSIFLDPTINITGKDINNNPIKYSLASKDHKNFEIIKDDLKCGTIVTSVTMSNELTYDLIIENKVFDDYVPLFALAVDLTFGDINRK